MFSFPLKYKRAARKSEKCVFFLSLYPYNLRAANEVRAVENLAKFFEQLFSEKLDRNCSYLLRYSVFGLKRNPSRS